MKTYILDIIPKIQKFSHRLDDLTVLLDKHWVVLDEETSNKSVFIFRKKNNQLLISENGIIEKGNWEYLGNNSLLIERNNGSFLYRHGFVDDYVLALKIDGKDEYALLINDEWFEKQFKTIAKILNFLNEKYIEGKEKYDISIPKHLQHNIAPKDSIKKLELEKETILSYKNKKPKYIVISQLEKKAFLEATTIIHKIKFEDGEIGFIYTKNKKYYFEDSKNKWNILKHYYHDFDLCINALYYYLKTNEKLNIGYIISY